MDDEHSVGHVGDDAITAFCCGGCDSVDLVRERGNDAKAPRCDWFLEVWRDARQIAPRKTPDGQSPDDCSSARRRRVRIR